MGHFGDCITKADLFHLQGNTFSYTFLSLLVMQGVVFQLFVIQREQELELAPGNTNWQSFATLVRGNTSIMILGI